MKTSNMHKIFLSIICMLFVLSVRLYPQNQCNIDRGLFQTGSYCSIHAMGMYAIQNLLNLNAAIDRIKSKFTSTTNDPCIPDALENLMRDRICNNSRKITIHCMKGSNKEVIYKTGHWYIICKKRFLFFFTYKKKVQIAQPPAGNTSYTAMFFPPELLQSSVDEIEETLFHELIHNAENYYGHKTYNNDNVSSENYTYTCTQQCYPTSANCPTDFSKCKTCNNYVLPSNR